MKRTSYSGTCSAETEEDSPRRQDFARRGRAGGAGRATRRGPQRGEPTGGARRRAERRGPPKGLAPTVTLQVGR